MLPIFLDELSLLGTDFPLTASETLGGLAFLGEWRKCSPCLEGGDFFHFLRELLTDPSGLCSPSDLELFLEMSLPLCPDFLSSLFLGERNPSPSLTACLDLLL